MKNEIAQTVLNTKEKLSAAISLEKSMPTIKTTFLKSIFNSIETAIAHYKKIPVSKLDNNHDYTCRIEDYYKNNANNWPGISYPLWTHPKEDLQIWLRIELEDRMYVGLVLSDSKESEHTVKKHTNNPMISPLIRFKGGNQTSWWLTWTYSNDNINYRTCNDEYVEAFDENMKCKPEIIDGYVSQITNLWYEAKAIIDSCESI